MLLLLLLLYCYCYCSCYCIVTVLLLHAPVVTVLLLYCYCSCYCIVTVITQLVKRAPPLNKETHIISAWHYQRRAITVSFTSNFVVADALMMPSTRCGAFLILGWRTFYRSRYNSCAVGRAQGLDNGINSGRVLHFLNLNNNSTHTHSRDTYTKKAVRSPVRFVSVDCLRLTDDAFRAPTAPSPNKLLHFRKVFKSTSVLFALFLDSCVSSDI
jgi:hypothetical protein